MARQLKNITMLDTQFKGLNKGCEVIRRKLDIFNPDHEKLIVEIDTEIRAISFMAKSEPEVSYVTATEERRDELVTEIGKFVAKLEDGYRKAHTPTPQVVAAEGSQAPLPPKISNVLLPHKISLKDSPLEFKLWKTKFERYIVANGIDKLVPSVQVG